MSRLVFKRPEYIVREALYNLIVNFRKGLASDDLTRFNQDAIETCGTWARLRDEPYFVDKDMPQRDDEEHMPTVVSDAT